MPRKRHRHFTGCWRCRARKVKCDEGSPCSACQRLGFECDGSSIRLIWMNGKESFRSTGRRWLDCEQTWGGRAPLGLDVVDAMIARCDDAAMRRFHPISHFQDGPFSIFQGAALAERLPRSPSDNSFNSVIEKQLFHHYVTHVTSTMMPFEHPWNPWKLYYAAASMNYTRPEEKALYHAVLVHSAFSLVYLGSEKRKMMGLAAKHYNHAIRHLNSTIGSSTKDYSRTVAAIWTMMMAEVYSGQSATWRHHLRGAWSFLQSLCSKQPWNDSQFACASTQSLLIVKVIGETSFLQSKLSDCIQGCRESESDDTSLNHVCTIPFRSPPDFESTLPTMITSTPHFGFTIGAEKIVLDCISCITTMAQNLETSKTMCSPFEIDSTMSRVLSSLEFCRLEIAGIQSNGTQLAPEGPPIHPLAQYQLSAFIFATHIYLYRMLLDVPPKRVAPYVSLVFQNVSAFMAESAGNFSLWPAFIAAVEAYRPEDLESSRAWMHRSTRYGQGNRVQIAKIIQEVWRKRDEEHEHHGIDKGLVAVDWRQVVRDLDVDILLV